MCLYFAVRKKGHAGLVFLTDVMEQVYILYICGLEKLFVMSYFWIVLGEYYVLCSFLHSMYHVRCYDHHCDLSTQVSLNSLSPWISNFSPFNVCSFRVVDGQ